MNFENLSEEEIVKQIANKVNGRFWWHSIDLGHGITTPGVEKSQEKLIYMGLPDRFDGLSVIDVGTYEGFYAFEAESRGAKQVVAADYFVWNVPGSQTRENFRLAHEFRNSQVKEIEIKVEDLSPNTVGMFDVVLFLGVLYHAQNPLLYLEKIRSITKGYVIIETHVDCLDFDRPVAAYYPGTSLNGDPTNFWGPNKGAVEGMLKDVGFRDVVHGNTFYPNYLETDPDKRLGSIKHARMIFYAYV